MLQAPTNIVCPDAETLATYVTGRLAEAEASSLSDHLDRCPRCQKATDDLAGQSDSLIAALQRRLDDTVDSDYTQLSKLIAGAALLQRETKRNKRRGSSDEPVGLEEFVQCLRKSRLVDTQDIEPLVREIAPSDTLALARALVASETLTSFQAKALVRGKYRGLVLGNYAVLDKLGEGGMGQVFKARHLRMGRVVCLKVMRSGARKSPEQVARFRREAETVAALSHPNIVVAHDADEADGIPYLVMECIDGIDLARYVEKHGPLSTERAVELMTQVARALEYAHGQGVIHRDIKPHNLMLDTAGNVKILDLGLVRLDAYLEGPSDVVTQAAMTSTGAIMGTIDYISPEQALNSRNADARSDIYSLGCTLHFLVTGKVLYRGETIMEKLIAHREQAVPAIIPADGHVSPALDAVFSRMVAKEPESRFASMSELVDDLERLAAGQEPVALRSALVTQNQPVRLTGEIPVVVDSPPVSKGRQNGLNARLRWSIAAVAACLVLAVSLGIWKSPPNDRSNAAKVEATLEPELPFPDLPPGVLANEGPGRVLIVLPHDWFYEDHFQQLVAAIEKKGLEYVVASSQNGHARPKHGQIEPVAVDMLLETYRPEDFDGVVFLGGNVGEFRHKGPAEAPTRTLVTSLLAGRRVIASVGDGWDAVKDAAQLGGCDCDFKNVDGVEVGAPKDKKWLGRVVKADKSDQSESLIAVMLDELSQLPAGNADAI